MKKILTGLLTFTCVFTICISGYSQAPQGFNYQAVARTSDGKVLQYELIQITAAIYDSPELNELIFEETLETITNEFGMFSIVICTETADRSGGTAPTVNDIEWGNGPKYLQVSVNSSAGFYMLEASQLLSVPYALHANNGTEGPQGPQGETGPPGPQGIQGLTGPEGPQGPQGLTGATGTQGVQGEQGPAGSQGVQGPQGIQGPTGLTGATGPKGDKGDPGTGLVNKGDWVTMTTYQPGDYVFAPASANPSINSMWILESPTSYFSSINPANDLSNWAEFNAPEGPQGIQGPEGPQGPQGIQGIQGAAGPQGSPGVQGIQGEAGPMPAHNWSGTSIRFQNPDLSWGAFTNLEGPAGPEATDDQTLTFAGTSLSISGGNAVDLATLKDGVTDADADPLNEIQDLQLTGDQLSITNNASATPIDLGAFTDNSVGWNRTGNNVTYMDGNVGVGTVTPEGRLSIQEVDEAAGEPLFQVLRKDGYPVFAVYEDGVHVYTDTVDSGKGVKGGFAVGGYKKLNKGMGAEYMRVTADSIRFYIDENPAKGLKGGFAVGGYKQLNKGPGDEYLRVTSDSVRVYINQNAAKGLKGGFAVGGYKQLNKAPGNEFLRVTPDSVRVYIDNDPLNKGLKGGFAVGGYKKLNKGVNDSYFDISGEQFATTIVPSQPKLLWYPRKNAFLTGQVLIQSPDSVGTNSFASGFETKAIGNYSEAFGYKSIARRDYSTAIGNEAVANGLNSFSVGNRTLAKGDNSFSFGDLSVTSGTSSFAFGLKDTASGNYSMAVGVETGSHGLASLAIGRRSRALKNYSIAMGESAQATGLNSVAIGSYLTSSGGSAISLGSGNLSSGSSSVAMGSSAESTGWSSISIGFDTDAHGTAAIAMGSQSKALFDQSIAIGDRDSSNNPYAVAIGYRNISNGWYATSIGFENRSLGNASYCLGKGNTAVWVGSTAIGFQNKASGGYAVALGRETIAQAQSSLAVGSFNIPSGDSLSWNSADPIFVVGNGSAVWSRSNALTLYKNGNMTIAGTLTQNSDVRLKENIRELRDATAMIEKIQPVYYTFINQVSMPGGDQVGFIAQEIQEVIPELVLEDSQGYLSVDYSKMSVVLLQAVKEQQAEIGKKDAEIEDLKSRLEKVEAYLGM